ncbi:NADH pyrophosphatase [Methylobrevis pamukkalensis]|uniref:NAD(+) diphosphatase n=1 Tax=Methylobrevis pamukkalensis TaxID=1439726 RepID=A0A1E3GX82_9HYPH|nr:NADH pyrophosphatase [Methylobrevis pamukkalensis]
MLLGWDAEGRPHVAALLAAVPEDVASLADLRALSVDGSTQAATLGIKAQARSLLHWNVSHRFCAACGGESLPALGGYRRDCPSCGASHFPRTDPVVIMMVLHAGRCLLGRQARFAPGVYSCLAGFLEPGETIEDAVRREIFEEAGLRLGAVAYHNSQPWPFPMTLMIGCYGEALGSDLVVDTVELEDCRWFDRDEVAAMTAGTHPDGLCVPPPPTIARHLIEHWLAEHAPADG